MRRNLLFPAALPRDVLAPKAAEIEHGTWRSLLGVMWHMESHHEARRLPEQGGATLARRGAPGLGRLLGLPACS